MTYTAAFYIGRRYIHHSGPTALEALAMEAARMAERNPGVTVRAEVARPGDNGKPPAVVTVIRIAPKNALR